MKKLHLLKKLTAEIMKQDYMQYEMPDIMIMILTGDINNVVQLRMACEQVQNVIRLDDECNVEYEREIPIHSTDTLYNVFKRYRRFQKDHLEDVAIDNCEVTGDALKLAPESRAFEELIEALYNGEISFTYYMMNRFTVVLKSIMSTSKKPQDTCFMMVKMGYTIKHGLDVYNTNQRYVSMFREVFSDWMNYIYD